jgi:Amt family ammonium transporter
MGLHHLHDLSVDLVKLSRTMLDSAGYHGEGHTLISAAIEVAQQMDVPVVACGIERQEQVQALRDAGCWYGQGPYLGGIADMDLICEWVGASRER